MIQTDIQTVDESKPLPVPQRVGERVLYALVVTALPLGCFSLGYLLKPDWQSGRLADYMAMLLIPSATWFFFPLMFYSILCLLLLLIAPERFAPRFVVRFGIYTGLLLALHYTILAAGTDFGLIGAVVAVILILGKLSFGRPKSDRFRIGAGVVLLLAGGLMAATGFLAQAPIALTVLILMASPFLCLVVALVTTLKLIRNYEPGITSFLWRAGGALVWLAAYGAAWRFSILRCRFITLCPALRRIAILPRPRRAGTGVWCMHGR